MNNRGVTLMELIIVFVLIGIMGVLLAPGIGTWLPNYRLRSAARDIVSTFRGAQMRAISENIPYQVSFNGADTGVGDNKGYIFAGAVTTLPSGITIASNTLQNFRAVFNPDCTCTNTPAGGAAITLQNTKGTQRTISIRSATGRVTIQ